jgi:Uma2 family endonuclease
MIQMEAVDQRKMSLEAYVAFDRRAEEPWEYVDGEAFLVTSASPQHNIVKRNVIVALTAALRGGTCLAMPDRQKVSTRRTRAYHYPDALVVCDAPRYDPDDEYAIENPTLLVEVLSPTTADYDRGGKFVHYRILASLREYVLVSVEPRLVERHRKLERGEWLLTEFHEGEIELSSVGVKLAWDDLWRDLDRL